MTTKNRKHSPEFKAAVVLELLTSKSSVAELARAKKVKDSLIHKWRSMALDRLPELFTTTSPETVVDERIQELERMLGQLTVENAALKKASKWLSSVSTRNGRS